MTSDKENVRVVCRCRPFSQKEAQAGFTKCVSMDSKSGFVSIQSQKNDQELKNFTFDAVYDEESTQVRIRLSKKFKLTHGQTLVYETTASTIVDAALDGFNGTIFAYGQTGTGKVIINLIEE